MNKTKTSFFIRAISCALVVVVLFLFCQINIALADKSGLMRVSIIPSDANYNQQWYLKKIKAQEAWDIKKESPQVIIAILDTGVDIDHPDLRDNIWINDDEIAGNGRDDDSNGFIDDVNGWDFVNNIPDPNPKFNEGFTDIGINHGTVVAGVAAAQGNNTFGIAGVTWQAQIMPLKVLADNGEGTVEDVIRGIDYAIKNKADIINLSFMGVGFSQSLQDAIARAYRAGIIIVAAAGNENEQGQGVSLDKEKIYPICYDGGENMVIGVAATDAIDQKAQFSNYGFACIDITAPGTSFFGLAVYEPTRSYANQVFNSYYEGFWNGTSMAAPLVSGSLALVKAANPKLSREQVIDILYDNADNISRLNPSYLGQLGRGRINLFAAVQESFGGVASKNFQIITAPQSKLKSEVKIIDGNSQEFINFLAYGDNFLGGADVASGDFDGDGEDEIITGAGNGGGPHIRVFDQEGNVRAQFFAYHPNFRGGVNVAVGDINGDGVDEIIAGAGVGGGPHIRVFNILGQVKGQFFAYDKNFRGGVNVAAGDINGDGIDEIITGAGPGGEPAVKIFNQKGKQLSEFVAYHPNFRGGVNISTGDIDGDGEDEIITGAGFSGGPHVRIFNQDGEAEENFFAYDKNFRGGVNVAVGDINQDGIDEIIAGAGPGGGPHVRVFDGRGQIMRGFFAYENSFRGGVKVGVVNIGN